MSKTSMRMRAVPTFLLALLLATTLAASARASGYTLRMGCITAHDTQARMGHTYIKLLERDSRGRIKGTLYPGGALGNNKEVLTDVQLDAVQAYIVPIGDLSTFVPQAGVFAMPWLYPGKSMSQMIENITRVMQGKAAAAVERLAAKKGFHIVSMFGISPQFLFTRKPVTDLAQLKGMKIRTVSGEEHLQTVEDWGAQAVNLPIPQIYTATQQGVIDGFTLPPNVTVDMHFQEVAPYVFLTAHDALIDFVTVSQRWYDHLPRDLQKAVDQAGRQLDHIGTRADIKTEVASLKALRKDPKVIVRMPTASDIARMKRRDRNGVWKKELANPAKGPVLRLLRQDIRHLAM